MIIVPVLKRSLLISIVTVLGIGFSTVWADDFYVIPVNKANYAPVPKTGQTDSYAPGDDGGLQKGVASPIPRFINNADGTVTDKLTGLIWFQNITPFGTRTWTQALSEAALLKDGIAGLMDGSKPGDWRLPNIRELQSLVDYGKYGLALPEGNPFTGVQSANYWSSTSYAAPTNSARCVHFYDGAVGSSVKDFPLSVWYVRGGP